MKYSCSDINKIFPKKERIDFQVMESKLKDQSWNQPEPGVPQQFNPDDIGFTKFDHSDNDNMLHVAVSEGDKDVIELLRNKVASINVKNDKGETPLHVAVSKRHTDVIELINKGASTNIRNDKGETPLDIAKCFGNCDTIQLLKPLSSVEQLSTQYKRTKTDSKEGKSEDSSSKRTRMSSHAVKDRFRGTKRTQNKGDTSIDDQKRKKLHGGSSIDSTNKEKLLTAAYNGSVKVVCSLLSEGVDVNFAGEDGNTPLHCAVEGGHVKLVKHLLSIGASTITENSKNETPYDIAMKNKDEDILKEVRNEMIKNSLAKLKEFGTLKASSRNKIANLQFVDGTFSGNYMIPLTQNDINNILKFQYTNDKGVFEAIKSEQLKDKLEKYESSGKNIGIFIIDLGNSHWVTLFVRSSEKNKFDTYYTDSSEDKLESYNKIRDIIKRSLKFEGELISLKSKQQDNECDSGVFALQNAEIIYNGLNKSSKSKKVPETQVTGRKDCEDMLQRPREIQNKRKLFANMLNEKKRTEDKIKSCLQILKDLNSDTDNNNEFSFKNVNVFIIFLETFALEDTYAVALDKQDTDELRSFKKRHFLQYYNEKFDIKIIDEARNILLHSTTILQTQDFKGFLVNEIDDNSIDQFFKSLEQYTQVIHNKISGQEVTENEEIKCSSFIKHLKSLSAENEEKGLLQMFSEFVGMVYRQDKQTNLEELEQMLFDLTVNIIPILNSSHVKVRELSNLRNNLIHSFQKHRNNDSRLIEFRNVVWELRSLIFKYYYSQEVHSELTKMPLDQKLDKDVFRKKLKGLEKKFQGFLDLSEWETGHSFEYVSSELLFSEDNESDIADLVGKYLRFMAVFDDEKRGKENPIDDEEESEVLEHCRELSDVERREIFESFVKLGEIKKESKQQYEEKKKDLKRKFSEYGVKESYFYKVIQLYVEGNHTFDKQAQHMITSIVTGLKSLRISKELKGYQISNQDILTLCDRFIKEKGVFQLKSHEDLLRNYNLNTDAEQFIEKRLNNLISNKYDNIDISYDENMDIQLNIAKVVHNILKTFYNVYYKYQVKFDNVEGAFSDKIFLDFLVSEDEENIRILQCKECKKRKTDNKNFYAYYIIKKLLKVEFTAPYIASLITKLQSDEVIEDDDLRNVIEILFKKNMYVTYLDKLLCVTSKKPDFNLYQEVWKFFQKGDINTESMHVILDNPKHAREILDVLGKRIGDPSFCEMAKSTERDLMNDVLDLLNDVVLELIYKNEFESANEILVKKDELKSKGFVGKTDNFIDNELNKAKLKNAQGVEKIKQNKRKEANKFYEEALEILKEIPVTGSARSLLGLSRKAYTQCLLRQYDESYKEYNNLYKRVQEITFDPDADASLAKECKKYLNIPSIKSSIAFSKLMQGNSKNSQVSQTSQALKSFEEALQIYNEVLNLQKENSEDEHKSIRTTRTRRHIMYVQQNIGKANLKLKQYPEALHHYFCALNKKIHVTENERKLYGDKYQDIEKSMEFIIEYLCYIATTYNKLGEKLSYPELHCEALCIYNNVYKIQKDFLDEENKNTLKTLDQIAFTFYKLTHLYYKNGNLNKAIKYSKKNLKQLTVLIAKGWRNAKSKHETAESFHRKLISKKR